LRLNSALRSPRNRAVAAGVALALAATGGAVATMGGATVSPRAAGEEEFEENPAEPQEWMAAQRANADGTVPAAAYREAIAQTAKIAAETRALDAKTAKTNWAMMGPSNIGGRIVDLVADPSQSGRVYVAAGTGGIWRSDDAGATFVQAWPEALTQSMGALAVTPDGTVFVGTGEPDHGGGGSYYGTGVYRSTDHGATWQNVGLSDTGSIGRIQVDPSDPSRIFVGAQGRLFDQGGERGLYLSENGGNSWTKVLDGLNDSTGTIDVSINTGNPDVILAAMWDKKRFPDHRDYGGPGSGIFRSTDGGQTWARAGEPLPAAESNPGRIGVVFSEADPDRAYAITNTGPGAHTGFFRSDDMGASWTRISTGDAALQAQSGGFAWWFGRLWVDPDNADHLFSAGVNMLESSDGGATWARSTTLHADQHGVDWDPVVEDRVYVGNDGGFYRSDANGSVTGGFTRPAAQPWMQFYAMDVSTTDASRVSGGTQDNGSLRSWGVGETDWNGYVGGDGMMNRIAPDNQDQVYGCSQNGGCRRSTNGGETTFGMTHRQSGSRNNWVSPIEIAPSAPDTVYYGSQVLRRSDDDGVTWRTVSPDLTDGPTPDNATSYATITTIGIAPTDANVVFVGTDDGNVWTTRDGGATWNQLLDPQFPEKRWVTRVTVDPDDANRAWLTFSGWRNESSAIPHVFTTEDGGATWRNISSNLPQAPVQDVIRHPVKKNVLYVATDMGVFTSPSNGDRWFKVGGNLPLAPIMDIHFQEQTSTLFAATFGRSIYKAVIK
jgi:photosystem II stability/assembly factor-like uncharacterized protein